MRKLLVCIVGFMLMGIGCFAQSDYSDRGGGDGDIRAVFEEKTPVFYGYDFSGFRLTNYDLLGRDNQYKKYFYVWLEYMDETVNPYNKLPKWLRKYELVVVKELMMNMVSAVPRDYIQGHSHKLEYEDIVFAIMNYELQETSGVGFVFNIENFNRQKKYATMYATFFDIRTRKILWCVELRSDRIGRGMRGWSEAMLDCVKQFIDRHYKPRL